MNVLNCTNISLAKTSNLDTTVISRFKNGNRIPTQNSITLNNLANGICELTKQTNKEKEVRALFDNTSVSTDLYLAIINWFSSENSDLRISSEHNAKLVGDNLDTLMHAFHISNIDLARNINRDASLISKYKNKTRALKINDDISNSICDFFIKIAAKKNKLEFLSSIIGFAGDNINEKDLKEHLMNYLYSTEKVNPPINTFLENLNAFQLNRNGNLPSIENLVSKDILSSTKIEYLGIMEFREAIKKFLGTIAIQETPTTLNLYSDENMNWLTQSKDFFNIWKSLMITILMKKNKIKVIHNIDRNLPEMFHAIEGWLPLYMSGLIEPYYCKRLLDNRFNHTIFLAQNLALISSFSVRSKKNTAIYNYTNDSNILKQYEKQYAELFKKSAPLVKIFVNENIQNRLSNIDDYRKAKSIKLENIEIMSKKDVSTLVLKTDTPSILFEFEHPLMINAFENYLDTFE